MIYDYYFPILASFFLFVSMVGYWSSLFFLENAMLVKGSQALIGASNLLFTITLGSRWIFEGYFPLSNLYESLIFLCWGISFLQLIIEFKTKSRLIGSITAPILFFICSFSSLTLPIEMQKALPLVPSLQSNWLMMHVSMMMISYSTLIVGSLLSLLYLAFSTAKERGEYKLNSENQVQISTNLALNNSKISLLDTIDTWSYRIIGIGFPFLTIGIISGAVWANEAWGSYWSWDPKETWALITWLVFAVYLHSRIIKGWEGQKAAWVGSFGFFVIWICYLGVNFLAKGLHSYGWVMN